MEKDPLLTPADTETNDDAYGYGGIPTPGLLVSPGSDVVAVERPEEYREQSTLVEKMGEIPTGFVEGAVKASPTAAGTLMGLATGLKVAPLTGPFAPLTVVLSTGAGLYAGLTAEDATTALIEKYDLFPGPYRDDLAPFREGAKSAGAFVPFAGGARFLPEQVDNWLSRIVSAYGQSARQTPKLFYTVEAMGAAGTGIGGGVAEAYYPGDPTAKFLLEFGGGAFFPFRTIVSNFGETKNVIQSTKELFGEAKAESRAAKRLQEIFNDPYIVETFKEDPAKVLQALRAPGTAGVSEVPTAAQKTGSAVLSAFEASLAKQSAQFGGDVESKGRAFLLAHKELINRLTETQDPAALVQAAKFQSDYFRDLISTRMKLAQAKIDPVVRGLTPDSPEYRKAIGESLQKATADALEDIRKFERELYSKAKKAGYRELTNADLKRKGIPEKDWAATRAKLVTPKLAKPSSVVYEALSLLESRGISPVFNEDVAKYLNKLGINDDVIKEYNSALLTKEFQETGVLPKSTVREINKKIGNLSPNELQNFRSSLLSYARQARAGQVPGDAQAYGALAQAALKDLEGFKIPEYQEALSFSRILNDHFSRAFPAEITASKRSGADKIPPELLVDSFFETVRRGGDRTALRMTELEDAVELAAWAKAVDNPKDAAATRAAFAEAVRTGDQATISQLKPLADRVKQTSYVLSVDDAFKKIFEQDARALFSQVPLGDGSNASRLMFNVDKYKSFLQQNDAILKRFNPTLYSDLQDVNKAEEYFKYVLDETSALNRNLKDQAAFAAVLNSPENVTRVVSTAFNSGNPVTQLQRLMDLTKNKKVLAGTGLGDAPRRGLSSSLYDWAFAKASPEPTGARGATPTFDVAAFKSAMFSPIKPGQPSLSEMMVKNGLADTGEMVRLKKIIDTIQRTQDAMGSSRFVQTLNTINPIEDLAIRMAGTNIASPLVPQGPGSIVAAGAGVRTFKKLFEDMPLGKTRQILEKAAKDPEFMASLMERGQAYNQRSFFNIGKRVIQSMERNGLGPLAVATTNYFNQSSPPTDEEIEERLTSEVTGPTAAQMLRQLPPAPPTRGVPGLTGQGAQPPAAPAAPTAQGPQAPTQSRAMFQSLFPMDTISPLLNQPR